MRLKPRIVAGILAVTMAVSLLQYPSVSVRAEEVVSQGAEDATVKDDGIANEARNKTTPNITQNLEQEEVQEPVDGGDADTNTDDLENNDSTENQESGTEDGSISSDGEDAGDNTTEDGDTKPDEGDGEKGQDGENFKPDGDNENATDDEGMRDNEEDSGGLENSEALPTTEQDTDTIQDGLEIDAISNETKRELESDARIATTADASGTFGENLTWELVDGTLIISGTGKMPDYGNFQITDSDDGYGFSGTLRGGTPWYPMNSEIENIVIERGITHIGNCSFSETKAVNVVIADSVTSIGGGVFYKCTDLVNIDIPNSIVDIGGAAFAKCSSLVGITIPETVASIGGSTFLDCINLNNITLPSTMTYIGNGAFGGCQNLENVKIPNGVTAIRDGTFAKCYGLTSVTIPKSVICISKGWAYGCENLTDIYYEGSISDWQSIKKELFSYNNPWIKTIHYNSSGMGSAGGDDSGDQPVKPPITPSKPDATDTSLQIFRDVYYYDTIAQVGINVDLAWSWDDLLTKNSSEYNQNLAKMGLALSASIEGSADETAEILISKLRCDTVQYCGTSPGAMFAHKTIVKTNGDIEHVVFVVLRGTTSLTDGVNDILSGINIGDWGVNGVYSQLNSCLSGWGNTYGEINSNNTKFFVAGHSLGGACANIISALLNGAYGQKNIFSYTFATPSPYAENVSRNYHNIHNFLCYNDNVPSRLNRQDSWFGFGYYTWFLVDYRMVNKYMDLTGKFLQDVDFIKIVNLGLHAPSAYMAFLMTNPDLNYYTSKVNYIRVKCPVDIEVYNSSNELVGHIVNDEVDYDNYTLDVMLTVDNGAKYVYFLNNDTYTIRFSGTGDGAMVYTAASKDMNSDSIEETKVYSDVKIEKGKKLKSIVSSYDETDTDKLVEIPDVELLVVDDEGDTIARVLSDNEASFEGKSNGTEIPINSEDNSDKPDNNKPDSRPGNNSGNNNADNSNKAQNSRRISSGKSSEEQAVVETWKPTTPDEKKRYACMGKDVVQYTLPKDNVYRIVIENAMQGPMCFKSFEAALSDYIIGRTYNIYTLPDSVYSKDEEIQFTIKIPSDIYKKNREYKMICVTKGGVPIVYNDTDTNPETITVKTNKFYAYALIYK